MKPRNDSRYPLMRNLVNHPSPESKYTPGQSCYLITWRQDANIYDIPQAVRGRLQSCGRKVEAKGVPCMLLRYSSLPAAEIDDALRHDLAVIHSRGFEIIAA